MTALRLRLVTFAVVDFDLVDDDGCSLRPVSVRVGSGSSWRTAVRFPTVDSAATKSTDDAKLDREICDRAAEELARLDAAVQARNGWSAA